MSTLTWPRVDDRLRWADEMFRAFAPMLESSRARTNVFPPVNVYDDGESFLLRAELPGVDKDALELTVKGDQLTLRGERKINAAGPEASYHRRERESGSFRRSVTLPQPVDANRIQASYNNGVLEVVLPRVAESQPRKITIH